MARETDIRSGIAGDSLTLFQELLTAEQTPLIVLNGSFPLFDIRDDQQTSGTASISNTNAEFEVNHASDGDFVRLASSSRGRYNPGSLGHFGIGIRLSKSQSELPSSGDWSIRWGYFDMEHNSGTNQETVNNGILWGVDKDGTFTQVISGGTETYKSYDWSVRNPSIDLRTGKVFQGKYIFYGYHKASFEFLTKNSEGIDSSAVVDCVARLREEW